MSIKHKKKIRQKIFEFIAELEALVPLYRDKWMAVALSCQPIEPDKAAATIKTAYAVLGKPEPEIFLCESPMTALDILCSQLWQLQTGYSISYCLEQELWQLSQSEMKRLLWKHLGVDFQTIKIELGCGEKERQRRELILNQCSIEPEDAKDLTLWHELLPCDCLKSHLEEYFKKRVKDFGFGNAVRTGALT